MIYKTPDTNALIMQNNDNENGHVALWPPMMSTRERLRMGEVLSRTLGRGLSHGLERYVPLVERHWMLTTYGKGAFELAVRDGGLAGKKILMPAFISHDYVGVFHKYDITPVFVDVDPGTCHITTASCQDVDLDSVAALIVLHTFGLPVDGPAFRNLCDAHGVILIEDCARALGAKVGGHQVGWFGDYAAFSLSKIAPVRRGGLLVSRRPIDVELPRGRAGVSGILNHVLLMKIPGLNILEGPLYRLLRETPVYPGEIGLYDPPPVEHPEPIVEFWLESFMPHYDSVMQAKRRTSLLIRERLEPLGFQFQPESGNHIYTALGALVPPGTNKLALQEHLKQKAINTYTLWGDPLGTSPLAKDAWKTDTTLYPVTSMLADRLIHFPISRFVTVDQVDRLVAACKSFMTSPSSAK